ncbi:MAG: DUF6789 family protein [Bacteriovoracia bacterium]
MEIILIVFAGLLGTTLMMAFMVLVSKLTKTPTDMVRALGSLWTRKLQNSYGIGLFILYLGGIFFSVIYYAILRAAPLPATYSAIWMMGTMMGVVHGMVVALLLIIAVAEHHPLPKFQKAGLSVAVAHLGGHVVYGSAVGLVYQLAATRLAWPPGSAQVTSADIVGFITTWTLIFGAPLLLAALVFAPWLRKESHPHHHLSGRKR